MTEVLDRADELGMVALVGVGLAAGLVGSLTGDPDWIFHGRRRPEGFEDRFFWVNFRLDDKPTISLVHRKGIELDGSSPLLLGGYGSYGSSRNASFSAFRISLLDRGMA